MFCNKCGRGVFDQVYGGSCSKKCVYCGHYLYCTDLLSRDIEDDSIPINNPVKAGLLARRYNKENPGSKEYGKENIRKHREAARNNRAISNHLRKR